MLAAGVASHVEALHGEPVEILEGSDAGRTFIGVIEIESDAILTTDLGEDPRAKRMVRFVDGRAPSITSQARVRLPDGKTYLAVRQDFGSYLTTDFELREV